MITYIGEGGESSQVAHTHQAEDKQLPSLGQQLGELVYHGRDHSLQTGKLDTAGQVAKTSRGDIKCGQCGP